jgi:hypothetical protein
MDKQRAYYRKYRKARDRALSRLASAYPDDYKELLEQEKASDEQLDKNWSSASVSIVASLVDTRASAKTTRPSAADDGEGEGDRGGEA